MVLTSVELPSQEEGEEGVGVVHIDEGKTGHAPANAAVTISAVPDEGYAVKSVKVNDEEIAANTDGTYTYDVKTTDIKVDVVFAEKFAITVAEAEHGKVEADVEEAFEGDTVTLNVTPESEEYTAVVKYTYSELVDGVATPKEETVTAADGVYSFKMPASDVTVTATFTAKTYAVNIGEDVAEYVTTNKATAAAGETVTLTVEGEEGYKLVEDSLVVTPAEANVEVKAGTEANTYTFEMPNVAVTVTAEFEEITYAVEAAENLTGGKVEVDKTTAVKGADVIVTVTPATGYELGALTITNGEDPVEYTPVTDVAAKYTFKMPAADVTVTATFNKIAYKIEKGTTPDGASIDVVDTAYFGDKVYVEVTAPTGYDVSSVTVSDGETDPKNAVLTDGKYTFDMPAANVTVNVTFAELYDVKISETEGVKISADITSATEDTVITLSNTPNAGYNFKEYIVKDADGNTVNVTDGKFEMPASDVTISAVVEKISYNITVTKTPEEDQASFVDLSSSTATVGDQIVVTITEGGTSGYKFTTISGTYGENDESLILKEVTGDGIKYTFIMPAGDVELSVNFTLSSQEG